MEDKLSTGGQVSDVSTTQSSNSKEASLHGVGGWLLFLCIGLTILSPIRRVFMLLTMYNEASPHFERFPGLQVVTSIESLLNVLLIGLSIHAGVALWQVRPRALQIARRFFYISLCYLPIGSALPFAAGLPSVANEAIAGEVVKGALQNIISATIWLMYLTKSKRVKATYPDAAYPSNNRSAKMLRILSAGSGKR